MYIRTRARNFHTVLYRGTYFQHCRDDTFKSFLREKQITYLAKLYLTSYKQHVT
jgi:hypothetical protein